MQPNGEVTITVLCLDGSAVFGPASLPRATSVQQLRTRITSARACAEQEAGSSSRDVILSMGIQLLQDDDLLGNIVGQLSDAQLTASFSAVSEERRQACKAAVRKLAGDAYERVMSAAEGDIDEDEEKEWLEEQMRHMFSTFSSSELADRSVMIEAVVELGVEALKFAADVLQDDAAFVLGLVHRNLGPQILETVGESLKADQDFMKLAVSFDGGLLRFAHAELQRNAEVAASAIGQTSDAFLHLPYELKEQREFLLLAASRNGDVLKYMDEQNKRDKEIVLVAVRSSASAFQFADTALKSDREFVSKSVQANGCALEFAASDFKDDEAVVLEAVRHDPVALQHANGRLTGDRDFVITCVRENGEALEFTSYSMRNDKSVVLEAVSQCGRALRHASARMTMSREVVLTAVRQDPLALTWAHASLQGDEELRARASS